MALSMSLAALSLLVLASPTLAASSNCPNPYTDPKTDSCNPLKYIASNLLTTIAVALVLSIAILQTCFIKKWGAKWMCSMTIGAYTFGLGLATRYLLHAHPQSINIYIAENTLVVLSPCLFIAADYVLLGRLAAHLNADRYLLISPRKISVVFVTSDVITFFIQAGGGGLLAAGSSSNASLAKLGSHIFLIGLILQLASFIVFSFLFVIFLIRVHKHSPQTWRRDQSQPWHRNWLALAGALTLSAIGIIVRSCFRVLEQAQGFDGFLATSEPFFYGFDTLPLLIAIGVYVPFWPGQFINPAYVYNAPFEMTRGRPTPFHEPLASFEG